MSENVDYVDAANTSLSFDYLGKDCGPEDPDDPDQEECEPPDLENQIERVRIELRMSVEGAAPQDAKQTLTTDVALRNRGG